MSLLNALGHAPARMTVTNLRTGVTVEAQFNPEELTEQLSVNYQRKEVVGLSHRPMQYVSTGNETFDLELFFLGRVKRFEIDPEQGLTGDTEQELRRVHRMRRFLKSLMFPAGGTPDIGGGGTPTVLLVWPRMLSVQCKLVDLSFTHMQFNRDGRSFRFTAQTRWEEQLTFRISSEEVFEDNRLRYGIDDFTEDF